MRSVFPLILICAWTAAQGTRQQDPPKGALEAIPICTVLANARQFDGQEITVRGTYYRVFHGSMLRSTACEGADNRVNLRLASNWKADKGALKTLNHLVRRSEPVDVVLRGVFRKAKDGCFGQMCSPYEIEETELLSATARVAHPQT
jgi:hypothetical protein